MFAWLLARYHYLSFTQPVGENRFLILPWVQVPCLASHVLAMISRRLSRDWQKRYAHPILLMETFVDRRFQGTCYKAANWHFVGHTTGRTRNGSSQPIAPVKDVYVYPLHSQARVMLQ
ncbi:MAG: Druantia anti-phage system protein DruA [Thermodesulfobacteriota bacterium]